MFRLFTASKAGEDPGSWATQGLVILAVRPHIAAARCPVPVPSEGPPVGDIIQFFTLSSHGLEAITEDEVRQTPGFSAASTGYRVLEGLCPGPSMRRLARLRTADDAFLLLGRRDGIGRLRSALALIGEWSSRLPIERAAVMVGALRTLPRRPRFAVSASFAGRRNYTSGEIEAAVAGAIALRSGWAWEPEDGRADLLLRVFVVHERGWIGLRITRQPLHRRSYKVQHLPGSLRPPVAAAMCRLAAVGPETKLVDACCGAGTILAEAAALGARAVGGDLVFEALASAATNLRRSTPRPDLVRWDARQLPLARGWANAAVSNLPWDVQVPVAGGVEPLQRELLAQLRGVVCPGGRAVLLVQGAPSVESPGWVLEQGLTISLAGRRPTILVLRAAE